MIRKIVGGDKMEQDIFSENPLADSGKLMHSFKFREVITFPLHYHSVVEWVYVYEGLLDVEVNHQVFHLKPGDFLNIGSHHIHGFSSLNKEIAYRLIRVDLEALRGYEEVTIPLIKSFQVSDDHGIKKIFQSIDQDEALEHNVLRTLTNVIDLLTTLNKRLKSTETQDASTLIKDHRFLEQVNAYIYKHYGEGLTLKKVSEAVGYHKDYLSRKFHECMNMPFKTYVKLFMITRAKEMLLSEDKNMEEIAYDCGFGSIVTFNRSFKEVVGMTPSKYKMSRND